MTDPTIVMRLRDLYGRPREVEFTDLGPFPSPGSMLQQRLLRNGATTFVLKSVPRAAGRRNPFLFDLLDNEIRAGARLGQVYPRQYPAPLSRLAGYNMDVEEPFALLHAYVGKPLAEAGGLDEQRRRLVQVGLLQALQATAAAGVVHGAVAVRHLWWTGDGVLLVDFESAQRVGERRRSGEPGLVDVRDDILPAGQVIRQLVLGEAASDHSHDPEQLRRLLHGVFEPTDRRPYATDLLSRLPGAPVGGVPTVDPEAALADGRRMFDELGAPAPAPAPVPDPAPADDFALVTTPESDGAAGRRRGGWRWGGGR